MRITLILAAACVHAGAALVSPQAEAQTASWTINQNSISVFETNRPKPPGATRQWMRFWINSSDLFKTGRHIAVGLRGNVLRSSGQITGVTGRGVTIGHTWGIEPETDLYGFSQIGLFPERRHGGCLFWWDHSIAPVPAQSQVEIFGTTWNRVYESTCAPQLPLVFSPTQGYIHDASRGLQDHVWYRYTIEVSDLGVVRYRIEDIAGNTLADQSIDDGWNAAFVTDGATQWIGVSDGSGLPQSTCISPYCDQPTYEPYWSVQVTQIEGGWY